MAKLDFSAIAQVVSAAKNADAKVTDLKQKLNAAELDAAYSNNASYALMSQVADECYKHILISEGCKWDNKAQKWDTKGEAMLANLTTIATDARMRYYNYDNKCAVTLDTEARAQSFEKALKKEYIRRRKDGQKTRARKDLSTRIKEMYNTLGAMLSGDTLLDAVCGALHCTKEDVNNAIK